MTQPAFPTGTVTFLFTDIEGSTRLVERLGPAAWPQLLEAHHAIIRAALAAEGGTEIKTEGDAFFVAFSSAPRAVAAASRAQRELAGHAWPPDAPIRVRMGLHTGEGQTTPSGDYVGLDVHRAARIAAAGHGGQVLISATTRALTAGTLPSGVTLRDLGEHRLKDLSQPERIAELIIDGLPSEHPPLHTLEAIPNNLPVQLTSFVGRQPEVAAATRLLEQTRLLTLTGPGGTGKTRLSLQIAAEALERFPDGVYFVALAAIDQAELVPAAIAAVIGLPDTGARPLTERLGDVLRLRQTLLVLDNFEQVLAAGPIVAELLRAAPKLKIVVTSRAPLRVSGEQEFPVPALGLPDPSHLPATAVLSQFEAVALFIQRAMAVQPSFAVTNENAPAVAEIAARLDGLPLAIELAAARIRLLTPDQMLARLQGRLDLLSAGARDLPDRQRTLRGAIAWSWDLLDEPSRALLARLSVFVGGAPLDAIGPVCDPEGELGVDVLDGLEALVDQSLVQRQERAGEPRFGLLETIREFAAERLVSRGWPAVLRERHARYFADFAARARAAFMGPSMTAWLDRLEVEHDNLRAAFAWAIEAGEAELALRLAGSLWRFWQIRGHLAEGAEQAGRALAMPGGERFPEARIQALDAAAGIAYWRADMTTARELYGQSLELLRQQGDRRALADGLYNLAMALNLDSLRGTDKEARRTEAVRLAEESLVLFRQLADRPGEGRALWALGNAATERRDLPGSRAYAEAALTLFREAEDTFMVGWCLYTRGMASFLAGDLTAARGDWTEALGIFGTTNDVTAAALLVDAFAWLAWDEGDRERAVRLSAFTDALEASSGSGLGSMNRLREGAYSLPDALADPRLAAAYAEGKGLSRSAALSLALAPSSAADQESADDVPSPS
ncbi:MAG: adenylate/guanylate cyclase domain-containing protein [Chloroflexota bacterium]|nr:MAG: adenylate/guanylate cyclase domain-containing protein [Chloroflexota bacterium]